MENHEHTEVDRKITVLIEKHVRHFLLHEHVQIF